MKIITIGREFGSGGRELGKRLAGRLGVPCYDKQIISEVAKQHNMSENYVENLSLSDIRMVYTPSFGKTFESGIYFNPEASQALATQNELIKALAQKGDCVFVGRGADILLKEYNPLNIFVHASEEYKLARCLEHIREGETEKSILKHMRKVDKERANTHNILSDGKWGDKGSYHLCVNTTNVEIDKLIPGLVAYVNAWFSEE